jgi:hypothetical protein
MSSECRLCVQNACLCVENTNCWFQKVSLRSKKHRTRAGKWQLKNAICLTQFFSCFKGSSCIFY